jgi:hypothetical protein
MLAHRLKGAHKSERKPERKSERTQLESDRRDLARGEIRVLPERASRCPTSLRPFRLLESAHRLVRKAAWSRAL